MKKILFLLVLCLLFTTTSCIITNEEVVKGTIDITVDAKKMTVSIDDDAEFYEVDINNIDSTINTIYSDVLNFLGEVNE